MQDHFEYIIRRHKLLTDNPPIKTYVSKTENRITFKFKTGYYVKLLMPEKMKLLRSTKDKMTKNKNSKNTPHLKITEIVLVHCNIINNDY